MTVAFSFDSVIQDNGMQLVGTDADGMPELQEEETFQSSFQETSLVAGGNDLGAGSVHTSTRAMYWCGSQGAARVEFRSITMHAISNDPGVHAKPCIYCQLDGQDALDIGDDEDLTSNEIMLIPTDASQVEPLFQALCRGAEDNPDEVEEDEGEFFFDQSGVSGLEAGVQQQLDNMVGRMDIGDIDVDIHVPDAASHPPTDAASHPPNGMQLDANAQDAAADHGELQDQVE